MAIWDVTPKQVKGPSGDAKAARMQVINRLRVKELPPVTPTPDPPPPAPASPFLLPPPGTPLRFHDDCTDPDPIPIWGSFSGEGADGSGGQHTRLEDVASGRLVHHPATRAPNGGPNGLPYREITVKDGDQSWGERGALGLNDRNGKMALYHEGEYHLTTFWVRLGEVNLTSNWRQIAEIKQAESYAAGLPDDLGPQFELQQHNGKFLYESWWNRLPNDGGTDMWNGVATRDEWTPISIEGFYTRDKSKGWLRVKQGAATTPIFSNRPTLLAEPGGTVPAYFAIGPYQDASLPSVTEAYADIRVYG